MVRRGQSFKLILGFNRPYNSNDLVSFVFSLCDDDHPNHGHGTLVGTTLEPVYLTLPDASKWTCAIDSQYGNVLEVLVKAAAMAPIGEWKFDIDTQLKSGIEANTFKSPANFFLLFNPWCVSDSVYLPGMFLFDPRDSPESSRSLASRQLRTGGVRGLRYDIRVARRLQQSPSVCLEARPIREAHPRVRAAADFHHRENTSLIARRSSHSGKGALVRRELARRQRCDPRQLDGELLRWNCAHEMDGLRRDIAALLQEAKASQVRPMLDLRRNTRDK